jgi:hypothetical protein
MRKVPSISGYADIDPRAKALWPISVSRDDNSLDMEKGMHYSINNIYIYYTL